MSTQNDQHVAMLRAELDSLGLLGHLEDESITDIMVNPSGHYFLSGHGGRKGPFGPLDSRTVSSMIATIGALHGKAINQEHPTLEGTIPFANARATVTIPPLSTGPSLTLRIPPRRLFRLAELVENRTLPRATADYLLGAIMAKKNGLIAGGVGSGKTTLLNTLLFELLKARPHERIVVLEKGSRELQIEGANASRLLTQEKAGLDLRRLLEITLRLNADRIVVGESRGAEAHDFIKTCNTGSPGSWLTVHANNARDSLRRLDSLAQEAGVPSQLSQIVQSLDVLVYMARPRDRRVVLEVLELDGIDEGGEVETTTIYSA